MNVIVEIESVEADRIARQFKSIETTKWIMKNRGLLVGTRIETKSIPGLTEFTLRIDPTAVIRIVKQ